MCGIAGIFNFDPNKPPEKSQIKRMIDCISHRGPDGEGIYIDRNIALGHRRLSIIDISTGHQPMVDGDRSIAVVFNGEIYNYLELKNELTKVGYFFRTTSDTEVIIKGYMQWGVKCLEKFNGMFAFALWDCSKKELFVARDRLGEKPLFYSIQDNTFIFGSEIKSILACGINPKPNFEVLKLYLTFGYIPAPYTFYQNILKLNPGNYFIISDGGVKEYSYWDVPLINENVHLLSKKDTYEQFESLFFDSIRIRMRSDVPFGAFLSGGLDSSAIVATMSKFSSLPVNTFTIGFKEKSYDERKLAEAVAKKFNTIHHEVVVEPDSFDNSLERIIRHYDEPFGDSSAIPTDFVSKFARQHVKMVLTGDGGDEVLSGYNSYLSEKINVPFLKTPSVIRKRLAGTIALTSKIGGPSLSYKSRHLLELINSAELNFEDRMIKKASWTSQRNISEILSSGTYIEPNDFLSDLYSRYPVTDPFYKLMYFHLKVSLPDDMLTKVDRMSMANSLETRVPFLDHRLVEFMINVPKDIKLQGLERKSVLRRTIGKKLPKIILNSPKKGFSVPLRYWFSDKGFDERVRSLTTQDFGLNPKIIQKIIDENNSGVRDHGNFIWMLFVLKNWIAKL